MKYNELQTSRQRKPGRKGRGISAGRGKTAGRGTKGQGARKSGGVRPGFEGGQMPVYMRLPKVRGFKSHRVKHEIVYSGQLDLIKKTTIDTSALAEAGLISQPYVFVKLVTKGDLKGKKDIRLQAASKSAIEFIKKAGGSFTKVDRLGHPSKNTGDKLEKE